MKKLVYLFLIAATLFACNQNEKSSNTDQSNNTPATTSPVPAASAEQYPAMPLDTLRMLYDRTDYIDFVFYTEEFSISQNEKPSIQSSFTHISSEQAVLNPGCKPIGRIFYQIEGVNRFEAEFFLSQDCIYYLFYQNGKKMYTSKMTQHGFNFFANIYKQIGKPIQ